MFDSSQPYTFDRVVRMVLTALAVVGLFFLLRYLSDVLVPFAIAAALAYFLNPLVTEIEKRTKRRAFAVFYTLAGIVIVGLALVLIMVPLVTHQVARFEKDLQHLRADLRAALLPIPKTRPPSPLPVIPSVPPMVDVLAAASQPAATQPAAEKSTLGLTELWEGWADYLNEAEDVPRSVRLEHLLAKVEGTPVGTVIARAVEFVQTTEFNTLLFELARRLAVGGFTVLHVAVDMLIGATVILVVLLYLVFLLLDFPTYVATWKSFLPPLYRGEVLEFFSEFEAVLRRYFRGQFIVSVLSGILYAIGFSLIGLPMAVPFGLLVGALNMVPYLATIAIVPAGLLAILRSIGGDSGILASFMWVGVVFLVVQAIQEALIVPRVMGKATGLSPVAMILGLLICSKLLGFLGLILAIPLTCLAIAYYRRFVLKHAATETTLAVPRSGE
ncbi:MAG TPA: AI-2E family transporter [Phycisphaerae bacterium]|nr:AI-2E family transporter [Phycisphaerae bacterium]